MFSNTELQIKIQVKSFDLSDVQDITSGPFIIETDALLLFIICLVIIQNSLEPICLFSTLASGPFVHSYTLHSPELSCNNYGWF